MTEGRDDEAPPSAWWNEPVNSDLEVVSRLLGRPPRGDYEIALRTPSGEPMVLANWPLLRDGTPMPTRYWLLDPLLVAAVGRIEAAGGVRQAEAEIAPEELADAHRRYAAERDVLLPAGVEPRPSGGVGGTRQGIKCLHAHYAWFLVGGKDPVGAWTQAKLRSSV